MATRQRVHVDEPPGGALLRLGRFIDEHVDEAIRKHDQRARASRVAGDAPHVTYTINGRIDYCECPAFGWDGTCMHIQSIVQLMEARRGA